MDDFRIPDSPFLAHQGDPFDPYDGADSVDITGLGLSTTALTSRPFQAQRAMRPRELDVDTASTVSAGEHTSTDRRQLPAPALQRPSPTTNPAASNKGSSRMTYFSALTQRCNHQGHSTPIRPASAIASKTAPRHLGDTAGQPQSQPGDRDRGTSTRTTQPNSASQPGSGDAGYRGIQDAIATKFQDLEGQIKAQELEITELRFALTDAQVATDTLETEKRKLKLKAEDLERRLRESGDKTAKVQEGARKKQEALEKALKDATDAQKRLQDDVLQSRDKAKQEEMALSDAHKTIKGLQGQLEKTIREHQDLMQATSGQHRRDMESANKKISDLTSQMQLREAELQSQRETSTQLTAKIEEIPERNFQALSTCVVKILERLDDSKTEILTTEKNGRHQTQDQHATMVQYLEGMLAASQKYLEMLSSYREESKQASEHVLNAIQTSNNERKSAEASCQARLDSIASSLQTRLEDQQASLLDDVYSLQCRGSNLLARYCDKQETTSRDLARRLDEQLSMSREQIRHVQTALCSLQKLEEAPKEDPRMVAKIQFLQEHNAHLASEIKDRDAQIATLETAYKERTASSLEAAAKYVNDIQQLSDSFRRREEEYRRALDQASELASKEAKRSLDEAREDAQTELQQERTKRQALEKDLRQAKEDLSVLEESNKRHQQAQDALQRELASTKLGNQAVTEHLEERTRVLEAQLGRDAAAMARLKAALADKEMDYANLRSSIEAYEGKVHVLIEHLRGWAQDYTHIGVIRARLEMLEQIDQSCAVTARIREAEQIDSVLALLRQYNARQYDGSGHPGTDTDTDTCKGAASLKTPANGPLRHSSSIRPPPVHNDRTVVMTLGLDSGRGPSSPGVSSSPIPPRPRRGRRTTAETHAAPRDLGSPLQAKAPARPHLKWPSALAGRRGDAHSPGDPEPMTKRRHTEYSAYFEDQHQDHKAMEENKNKGASDDISTSPPSFIKIEDP